MSKAVKATEPANPIAVFQETTIRRTRHNEEWWFAIVDVVPAADQCSPTCRH